MGQHPPDAPGAPARRGLVEAIGQSGLAAPSQDRSASGGIVIPSRPRSAVPVNDERIRAISAESTAPGGSYVPPTRSGPRSAGLARPGNRRGLDGRRLPPPAGTSSPWPPTSSWPSRQPHRLDRVFGGKLQNRRLVPTLWSERRNPRPGASALMFSPQTGFSEDDGQRLNEWLRLRLRRFHRQVAAGRGHERDAVHEVARGRVWTGR